MQRGKDRRGACGIALGCVDGCMLENISISHVQMDQVRVPFFITEKGLTIFNGYNSLNINY